MVVGCTLLIPGGQPPELLAAIDEPLNLVPLPVDGPIEWSGAMLIDLARNGDPDPMLAGILPDFLAAIALVTHEAMGPTFGAAAPRPLDRSLLHQLGEDHGFVPLAWRQDQGQELTVPFRAEVYFGAKTALAAP